MTPLDRDDPGRILIGARTYPEEQILALIMEDAIRESAMGCEVVHLVSRQDGHALSPRVSCGEKSHEVATTGLLAGVTCSVCKLALAAP
jgi:hypothetical protein